MADTEWLAATVRGLFRDDRANFLDLAPLVRALACPICSDEEVVYYNGMRSEKKVSFLGYQRGHEFDEVTNEHPFARWGITP